MKELYYILIVCVLIVSTFHISCSKDRHLTPMELLGKKIFFDENLSDPPGQACATCHQKKGGWAGPVSLINKETAVFPGALSPRFGNRKPPSASYTGFSPPLHRDKEGTFVGGLFWNGRAAGWKLKDPLAEQAMEPFLNPLEQNMKNREAVIKKVMASGYADLFKKVWGNDSLSLKDAEKTYTMIARSLAAYQRSVELNPFNSPFDDFWRKAVKKGLKVDKIDEKNMHTFRDLGLNERELKGLVAFNKKGKCADCHVLTSENGKPPLFTDFTYDNLGTPRNKKNPFYRQAKKFNPLGKKWVDLGLGEFLQTVPKYRKYARGNMGKQKVPSLRNVDLRESEDFVKAFMHNGVFTTLKEVVDFYNTRDVDKKWGPPEVKENVNTEELGDLKLTDAEIDDMIFFMKTLSDR